MRKRKHGSGPIGFMTLIKTLQRPGKNCRDQCLFTRIYRFLDFLFCMFVDEDCKAFTKEP